MTDRPVLCVGPASRHLGAAIGAAAGLEIVDVDCRVFPDSEVCIGLPETLRDREIVILQGTEPPQDRHLQQLYQMVEAARSLGAKPLACVVPYMAYARQDRRSRPGEPLSVNMVFRTLHMLGAGAVISVELHNPAVVETAPLPVINISADAAFVQFFKHSIAPTNPVLVAADQGGSARISRLSDLTGWPKVVLDKHKNRQAGTFYTATPEGLSGRNAIVVDDLCSSGSTLEPLSRLLKDAGCVSQLHVFGHFLGDAERVRARVPGDVELMATNTIASDLGRIPITDLLARGIRQLVSRKVDA